MRLGSTIDTYRRQGVPINRAGRVIRITGKYKRRAWSSGYRRSGVVQNVVGSNCLPVSRKLENLCPLAVNMYHFRIREG